MINQKELSRKYNSLNGHHITLKKFVVPHGKLKMMLTIFTIYDYFNYNHCYYTDGEIVECNIRKARYNGKYVTFYINHHDTVVIADFVVDAMVLCIGTEPTNIDKKVISKIYINN